MTADSPIYCRSLELENVRCFGQGQRLDCFGEDGKLARWTLILGNNGVGKTTLLQCLSWMRPVPIKDKDGKLEAFYPALNDEDNPILRSLIRMGDDVRTVLKGEFSVGQKLGQGAGVQDPEAIATGITLRGSPWELKERELAESDPKAFKRTSFRDIPMFGYGATRKPGTVKQEEGTISDPLASLHQQFAELYDPEGILEQFDYRSAKTRKQRDRDRLQKVKEILAAVLPDVEGVTDIDVLAPPVIGHTSERSGVQFKTPYGTVPLSGLSLGYQTMLTWVLDLVLRLYERYPDSSDPLSEPGIVLIDELDLHLHPSWQREIMDYLADCFPAIQFVATAHSPLIAQAARNAKLIVLRETEGEAIIDDQGWRVNSWRADQILASGLFGIPTRSKEIEELRRKRDELLGKPYEDSIEEEQLQSLQVRLDLLETADDPEDQAAMDLIRRVAANLKESGPQES